MKLMKGINIFLIHGLLKLMLTQDDQYLIKWLQDNHINMSNQTAILHVQNGERKHQDRVSFWCTVNQSGICYYKTSCPKNVSLKKRNSATLVPLIEKIGSMSKLAAGYSVMDGRHMILSTVQGINVSPCYTNTDLLSPTQDHQPHPRACGGSSATEQICDISSEEDGCCTKAICVHQGESPQKKKS